MVQFPFFFESWTAGGSRVEPFQACMQCLRERAALDRVACGHEACAKTIPTFSCFGSTHNAPTAAQARTADRDCGG
jgi:hypothetical protein